MPGSWKFALLVTASLAAVGSTAGTARGILVGDPSGTPPDSPANHIDPNVTTSPYGGVVGIDVAGLGPGSGVLLKTADPTHSYVLTAARVVSNGGQVANSAVSISVNYSGARSTVLGVSAIHINPAYGSFGTTNDDLAVLQLNGVVPVGVPTYDLYRVLSTVAQPARTITMVGYGNSGNGVSGVTVAGDTSVKRVGQNQVDLVGGDDEGGPLNEVYALDFDRPNGTNGPSGGPSLGNTLETNFGGGGDTGGPAFVPGPGGTLLIYGINTFGLNGSSFAGGSASDTFPLFGSGAGGQITSAYTTFIDQYTSVPEPTVGLLTPIALLWLGRRTRK